MPREVSWGDGDVVHAVRYATLGRAVVITGCGLRAPTLQADVAFRGRSKFGRPDGRPCRHPGCVAVREEDADDA